MRALLSVISIPAASAQACRSRSLPSPSSLLASIISLPIISEYVMLFLSVVVIGTSAVLGVFYDCILLAVRTCSS
jgi:hypothetical protein